MDTLHVFFHVKNSRRRKIPVNLNSGTFYTAVGETCPTAVKNNNIIYLQRGGCGGMAPAKTGRYHSLPPEQMEGEMAKKIVGIAVKTACVIILALMFFTGLFYTLSETETAVITTFGQATVNNNKGLQFKIPIIQKVKKLNTTVQSMEIGYRETKDGVYTNVESESIMITSDTNFVDIDFYVTYQVVDPIKYLYATEDPELMLKNFVQSAIRGTVSAYTVDSALTTGKSDIQRNIRHIIMNMLEKQDIGLALVDISIQDVEPPTEEVKKAFSDVEDARQEKESKLNQANQYRNEQIPTKEAEADEIVQKAEAAKQSRINEANGQVARFNSEYEEYVKYPLITKQRLFYEAMESIMPKLKIVINDDENGTTSRLYLGDIDKQITEQAK